MTFDDLKVNYILEARGWGWWGASGSVFGVFSEAPFKASSTQCAYKAPRVEPGVLVKEWGE